MHTQKLYHIIREYTNYNVAEKLLKSARIIDRIDKKLYNFYNERVHNSATRGEEYAEDY